MNVPQFVVALAPAVLAGLGAYVGVRVEIRHLWRVASEHAARITRIEDRLLKSHEG